MVHLVNQGEKEMNLIEMNLAPSACPYDFDEINKVCWKATMNGSMASSFIEYDHGHPNSYDGVRHGIANCLSLSFFSFFPPKLSFYL